jgi:hypothetical protein
MKKVVLAVLFVAFLAGSAFGADLNLRATWTANTDTVTTGYRLYRTDGVRTLVASIPGRTTASHDFTITVPDGSTSTLRFVMTATSATKESADSLPATYFFDLTPIPAVPGGFGIQAR